MYGFNSVIVSILSVDLLRLVFKLMLLAQYVIGWCSLGVNPIGLANHRASTYLKPHLSYIYWMTPYNIIHYYMDRIGSMISGIHRQPESYFSRGEQIKASYERVWRTIKCYNSPIQIYPWPMSKCLFLDDIIKLQKYKQNEQTALSSFKQWQSFWRNSDSTTHGNSMGYDILHIIGLKVAYSLRAVNVHFACNYVQLSCKLPVLICKSLTSIGLFALSQPVFAHLEPNEVILVTTHVAKWSKTVIFRESGTKIAKNYQKYSRTIKRFQKDKLKHLNLKPLTDFWIFRSIIFSVTVGQKSVFRTKCRFHFGIYY